MGMTVSREKALEYIEGYYKPLWKYEVDEKTQPHFWEAVIVLCSDINADVSNYVIRNDRFFDVILKSRASWETYRVADRMSKHNVHTVEELAKYFAEQIIESESTPIKASDMFVLQRKVAILESLVNYGSVDPESQIFG